LDYFFVVVVGSPPQPQTTKPTQDIDLLSHNPFEKHQPDVLDVFAQSAVNTSNHQAVDLLSFDNDFTGIDMNVNKTHCHQ